MSNKTSFIDLDIFFELAVSPTLKLHFQSSIVTFAYRLTMTELISNDTIEQQAINRINQSTEMMKNMISLI